MHVVVGPWQFNRLDPEQADWARKGPLLRMILPVYVSPYKAVLLRNDTTSDEFGLRAFHDGQIGSFPAGLGPYRGVSLSVTYRGNK